MYSTMAKIIDSTIAVMSKTGETFEETDKQISMAIKVFNIGQGMFYE